MYTLYSHPFSQHSRRVIALLEEAGLAYEAKTIDLGKAEHLSPHYLAINPNHQVPTLIGEGVKIHESGAILRWLCTKHDLADWYPVRLVERAETEQWLEWTQSRMQPAVVDIVLNTVFLGADGDKAAIARGHKAMQELSGILEASLEGRTWIAGTTLPSIADLALGTNITHLALANAAPDSPNITAWLDHVLAIPGFAKAMPPQMANA
jgi:glutathione S-transferase